MIRALALVALMASQAHALSCLPSDVAADFHTANDAKEFYVIAYGKLRFNESRLPEGQNSDQMQGREVVIPARLNGWSLTSIGFTRVFDERINLRVICLGPWCGGAVSDLPHLTFLKRTGGAYELEVGPCPSMSYAEPSQEQLNQAVVCFQGGHCPRPF